MGLVQCHRLGKKNAAFVLSLAWKLTLFLKYVCGGGRGGAENSIPDLLGRGGRGVQGY